MKAWSALLFALASLSVSCQTGPSAGTRTHWLQECDSESDCDTDSVCICEICTATCLSDDDCDGGACPAPSTLEAECDLNDSDRVCLPQERVAACETRIEAANDFQPSAPPTCGPADALLCETFDTPPGAPFQIATSDAVMHSQSCNAQAGGAAFSYLGLADSGYGHVQMYLAEPVDSGPLHVRFWAYIPPGQNPVDLQRVFALRQVPEYTSDQVGIHFGSETGVRLSTSTGSFDSDPTLIPTGEWFCLEAAFEVGEIGSAEIFVDGQLALRASDIATLPAPGPASIAVLGGSVFAPDPQFEYLVDELIVATSPIGCN